MVRACLLRTDWLLAALLCLCFAPGALSAGTPETWIPARWEGGPLEVARRANDKALADPAVREALANWYDPATLGLLDGSPVNCLLLTLSAGADPKLAQQQQPLVREYARKARERGLAVLGLVHPGAEPSAVASAAEDAKLDGLVLEGEFPDKLGFAGQLEKLWRPASGLAVIIPIASSALLRKTAWPVLALEGVTPSVGKLSDVTIASASGGMWIDSNMWLVRSFRPGPGRRPVWIAQRPTVPSVDAHLKSIADAAAAGGHWIVTLEDGLRPKLLRRDAEALSVWRRIGVYLAFFEDHAAWHSLSPFGTVGLILDPAGPNLAHSEECLNLVARRQIPYRVIERSQLGAPAVTGLRAVFAFDLAPPTAAERKILLDFAEQGGLVLGGPSWGTPPKDQSYTMLAAGQGELAVYKDPAADPASVARDLNDLLPTPELGVSVFGAPSVLSYVSTTEAGDRLLIQSVNYAGMPAESLTIWIAGRYSTARFYSPESAPVDLTPRRSGSRTEIVIPQLSVYGALLVEQ
jgi:hypothetical protein